MKLSDLKPCACCAGPLLNPMTGQWYVLRISQAMVNPRAANEVLGLAQYFQGHMGLAEMFAPGTDDAVWVLADKDKRLQTELHVCFNCFHDKLGQLGVLLEKANETITEAVGEQA